MRRASVQLAVQLFVPQARPTVPAGPLLGCWLFPGIRRIQTCSDSATTLQAAFTVQFTACRSSIALHTACLQKFIVICEHVKQLGCSVYFGRAVSDIGDADSLACCPDDVCIPWLTTFECVHSRECTMGELRAEDAPPLPERSSSICHLL